MASPLLDQLERDARKFIKVELVRLGQEVKFIDEIDTSLDFMVGSVVESLMTKMDPIIIQNTNLPEDNAVVRGLVINAIYKAIDSKMITGISDVVNRRPGELFAEITGDSELANLINSVSNRTSSRTPTSLNSFSRGTFDAAEDVVEDLYDVINRLYNKVFNIIGMMVSQEPSTIGHFAMKTLELFRNNGTSVNSYMDRFNEVVQIVADNCAALDSSYYAIDHFQKTRDARAYLDSADAKLVNVRSTLIYSGVLNEYRYGLAQNDVQSAADVLVDNGGAVNRVQEIMGALEELDALIVKVDDEYRIVDEHFLNLQDYMDQFDDKYDSSGTVLGIMTNIQAEIRSIMNSMDLAVSQGFVSKIYIYERRWWMQLITIVEKMNMIPTSVSDYFSTDPDGYISDYNTNVAIPLQGITFSGIDLLRSQLDQLKYWVGRKLASDIPVTQIVDLVSQMISDNIARSNEITSAMAITNAFSAPISEVGASLMSLLDEVGMDRAYDLFARGNWSEFFVLKPQNATYLGQLESSMVSAIEYVQGLGAITVNGLAAMQEALIFVRDQKRARDILASTFTVYKDLGLDAKINIEIPAVQEVGAKIDRFKTEAEAQNV